MGVVPIVNENDTISVSVRGVLFIAFWDDLLNA
jgi:glutamate 5-kinase